MRQQLLLCLIAACAITKTRATDRVVVPGGGGGTFSTIQSALDASFAGDRILVTPATYSEDLTILRGVDILSNNASQRFTINGHVDVGTASATATTAVTIANARILNGIYWGNSTLISRLRLIECTVTGSLSSQHGYGRLECFRDTIDAMNMRNGMVAGCRITSLLLDERLTDGETPIATVVGSEIGDDPQAQALEFRSNGWATVQNCIIRGLIRLDDPSNPAANDLTLLNNTIIRTSATPATVIFESVDLEVALDVVIRNNLIAGSGSIGPMPTGAIVDYNLVVPLAQVNVSNGQPQLPSAAVDGGDPNAIHTDLDLSRNDIGCYGGSLSFAQFNGALPTTAIVAMVEVERRVVQGSGLNIVGYGYDR